MKLFWFVVYACLLYSNQESGALGKRQVLLLNNFMQIKTDSEIVTEFYEKNNVTEIVFLPYARVGDNYNMSTKFMYDYVFERRFTLRGIHTFPDPVEAIKAAQGIFVIGGNSFVLLKTLYDLNLIDVIRKRVLEDGMPYMGSSAGANVATRSIQTSNDMPIVYPPSFDALNLVPFNINPHYIIPNENKRHGSESRVDRLREFLVLNDHPVLALQGNSLVTIDGDNATLRGTTNGFLFTRDAEPMEVEPGSDLSFLLK